MLKASVTHFLFSHARRFHLNSKYLKVIHKRADRIGERMAQCGTTTTAFFKWMQQLLTD
jgi:hypothetical protein